MEIRPATPEMFEDIHEVLLEFGGALTKEDWRRLLDYRFSDEPHRGWVGLKGEDIVGFLGAIYSEREGARICDVSSWIVKAEHRKGNLHLLKPLMDLEEQVVLNFSPSAFTLAVFKRLGFEPLDEHLLLIPALTPSRAPRRCRVLTEPTEVMAALTPAERRIRRDHLPYGLSHLVLNSPRGHCYLVASRTRFRRWPVSYLHHVSNPELFAAGINVVQRALFRAHGTLLTAVDSRLVEGFPIRGAYRHRLAQPRLYRPATSQRVERRALDSLYSEFVVLNPRRWTFNF